MSDHQVPAEARQDDDTECTCPTGDGSLRWPCPTHPSQGDAVDFMATELLRRLRQTAIGHHGLISAALITARAQGAHAEGLHKGREFDRGHTAGLVDGLAARPSADTETLRRVRALLSPNGVPLHDSKRITVGDLRAALDGTPPATSPEPLRDALRAHHPIMRSETGPFSGCRCGQVGLGQDVIAHVVGHLVAALDGAR